MRAYHRWRAPYEAYLPITDLIAIKIIHMAQDRAGYDPLSAIRST